MDVNTEYRKQEELSSSYKKCGCQSPWNTKIKIFNACVRRDRKKVWMDHTLRKEDNQVPKVALQ